MKHNLFFVIEPPCLSAARVSEGEDETVRAAVIHRERSQVCGHTLRVNILARGYEREQAGLMGLQLSSAATTPHPIPKEVNAAPWGLGSHHHPLSFHPYFSPPAWSESSGYRSHSGLLLISFLSLSLSIPISPLSPSPNLSYLICEGKEGELPGPRGRLLIPQ